MNFEVLLLRHAEDGVRVQSDPEVGLNQKKEVRINLTGSTLASTNPPAIGVLYSFVVTPG